MMCAEVISMFLMNCVCDTIDFIALAFDKYNLVTVTLNTCEKT